MIDGLHFKGELMSWQFSNNKLSNKSHIDTGSRGGEAEEKRKKKLFVRGM
jgi:hypothetical protein